MLDETHYESYYETCKDNTASSSANIANYFHSSNQGKHCAQIIL